MASREINILEVKGERREHGEEKTKVQKRTKSFENERKECVKALKGILHQFY